jgi:competence protein ComEA
MTWSNVSQTTKNQLTTALIVLVVGGSSYLLGATSKPAQLPDANSASASQPPTSSVISDIQQAIDQPASSATGDQTSADPTEAATAPSGLININQASAAQLDTLPGIGATKAQAIIDYRTQNGPFLKVDDLEKVKGIGPATVEKLRPKVTI